LGWKLNAFCWYSILVHGTKPTIAVDLAGGNPKNGTPVQLWELAINPYKADETFFIEEI
jgi:hypothetical protein